MSTAANNPAMEWLDLRGLTKYAAVSERTLRAWIHDQVDPLPASQVGNKILVRRRAFDDYLEKHKVRSAASVDHVVEEILSGMGKS